MPAMDQELKNLNFASRANSTAIMATDRIMKETFDQMFEMIDGMRADIETLQDRVLTLENE